MSLDDSSLTEELEILGTSFSTWLEEKTRLIASMLYGKKVLEVGCGTGNLIQFLSNMGFEITGSDHSNVYLSKAKEKNPDVKFFKADLLDKKMWINLRNLFDSVIASEVIEHIEDDLKSLKTIFTVLKPNGVLVLTVPAFNLLYSPLDKKIGHFRRYSKKSIRAVIEDAGFKVEKIRYWNLLGLFGWLLIFRILKKDLKSISKLSLTSILGKWLKVESAIPMPLGLTIFVKARKLETEQ